jgi:DNA-binding phage protein
MPLTRPFKETVMERLRASAGFREAMLRESIDALLNDEMTVGKSILRDYINATIGFTGLGKMVGLPPKSLMRMLNRAGNPSSKNLFAVISALQRDAGIEFHVAAE